MDSKPLFRKISKTSHDGYRFYYYPRKRAKFDRHTKNGTRRSLASQNEWKEMESMYDYTPLFLFLLKKVGTNWDDIWKECQQRLNSIEPVLIMVVNVGRNGLVVTYNDYSQPSGLFVEEQTDGTSYGPCFRYGENTYFSTLFVDDNHLLQYVDSDHVHPTSEYPFDTISFNGKPVPNNCF